VFPCRDLVRKKAGKDGLMAQLPFWSLRKTMREEELIKKMGFARLIKSQHLVLWWSLLCLDRFQD
jgi:hypothetical protein